MTEAINDPGKAGSPGVSFIMPCYNEEDNIGYAIPRLIKAFERAGHRLQLVAVDNGSHDRTGEIIAELAKRYPCIVPQRVEQNQGYGHGILSGIALCTEAWLGIIPADGQVDDEDVVRLFEAVQATDGRVLGKVRRRFRMDGLRRKIVSIIYNLFVRLLWPSLDSLDINGSPKILPRASVLAMNLSANDWFLDAEIMVKAHYMGLRILEFNVFARMRGNGVSHVRAATCWEFVRNLLAFRFNGKLGRWQRTLDSTRMVTTHASSH